MSIKPHAADAPKQPARTEPGAPLRQRRNSAQNRGRRMTMDSGLMLGLREGQRQRANTRITRALP